MTNRKCGTCRFYEAGTQQTHGWCRNPAYPRRDDVALLRLDELGCRSGWGKDFWEARGAATGTADVPAQPSAEAAQIVPVPIGTGIAAHTSLALLTMTPTPAAMGALSTPAAHQRGTQEPLTTANPLANAPKDGTMKTDLPLSGHAELDDQGVPIRTTRRSSVAEAHRRALARREQERDSKAARDRALTKELTLRPMPAPEQPTVKSAELSPTPPAEGRGFFGFNGATQSPARMQTGIAPQDAEALRQRAEAATPPPGGMTIAQQESVPPAMPRKPQGDTTFPAATPAREPEDVIISTVETVQQETSVPRPGPSGTIPTQAERPPLRRFTGATERPAGEERAEPQRPVAPVQESAPPVTPPSPARYWDQPGTGKGFDPLRQERAPIDRRPQAREERRPVPVGRQAAVQEGKPVPHRTIRQLGAPVVSDPPPSEQREVAPPLARPAPTAEVQSSVSAPPPPSEPAPRQIDEALLRQLEADWQAGQLDAHTGQRCGTCRFFQASGTEHGICNCPFAPVYRRQTRAESLDCLSALGIWWSAPDEGWLERTERRPRRATPLLDALLREREAVEPLRAAPERRRGTR